MTSVELLTLIETGALVAVCPAALLATAVSTCAPFDREVVFREKLKGTLVTAAPVLLPSTWNCTLVVLAETLVEMVMVPETVAPEAGEVMVMVGAADVELLTLMETAALVVVCAAALLAIAVSAWLRDRARIA